MSIISSCQVKQNNRNGVTFIIIYIGSSFLVEYYDRTEQKNFLSFYSGHFLYEIVFEILAHSKSTTEVKLLCKGNYTEI